MTYSVFAAVVLTMMGAPDKNVMLQSAVPFTTEQDCTSFVDGADINVYVTLLKREFARDKEFADWEVDSVSVACAPTVDDAAKRPLGGHSAQ